MIERLKIPYLIGDDGHGLDVGVVAVDPVLVDGNVLCVEQLGAGRVLAQDVLRRRAGVHEGLSRHRQAAVDNVALEKGQRINIAKTIQLPASI